MAKEAYQLRDAAHQQKKNKKDTILQSENTSFAIQQKKRKKKDTILQSEKFTSFAIHQVSFSSIGGLF